MDHNDNKRYKKLTDKGWQAMRQTLDTEMPEKQRRRPIGWFWLFGLLGLAAAAIGWWMSGTTSPAPTVQKSTAPVAAVQATQPTQRPVLPASEKPVGTSSGKARPEKYQLVCIFPDADRPVRSELVREQEQPEMPKPGTPEAGVLNFSAAPTVVMQNSESAGSREPEQRSGNAESWTSEAEPAIKMPENSPIAAASTPTDNNDSSETAVVDRSVAPSDTVVSLQPPITPNKFKPTWTAGAVVGVLSEKPVDYSGLMAGLSLDWQPFRKWGLRTGISYQYLPLAVENRPVVSLTQKTYVDATGDFSALNSGFNPGTGTATATGQESVLVPVARLHRLEMPLTAYWQPVPKFRVYTGAALGCNFYAQSGNRSLTNSKVYAVQSGTPNQNLNKQVSREIRATDFRWSIGFGFKPIRHLELGLHYQLQVQKKTDALLYQSVQDSFVNGNVKYDPVVVTSTTKALPNSRFMAQAVWFF